MAKKIPERLAKILGECNLTVKQATWDCHGTPVVLHKALEKIAAHYKISFDQPNFIETDAQAKIAVISVRGHMAGFSEWSIGEAAPYNNKNSYPYAMAEKRAKDRVILKLVGLHGDVYSEEEADDFKAAKPQGVNAQEIEPANDADEPQLEQGEASRPMDLTTEDRANSWVEFYTNINDGQRYADNEAKYQKFLKNNPDVDLGLYEKMQAAKEGAVARLMKNKGIA